MTEVEALNSKNQPLDKSLSSENEFIKNLNLWNTSKKNLTVKSKVRFTRAMKKQLLQEQVKELMKKKEYLQELLDLTGSLVVTQYEKGKYADSIRQVYIKLLNMKVGRNNVKEVIETV